MSYDLFFIKKQTDKASRWSLFRKPPKAQSDHAAFAEYFSNREFYRVENNQALYINESSGVYFRFNIAGVSEGHCASFNMNYSRPHVFALEAEPELTAFIQHFDLAIEDPQMHGMGSGPYSPEAFIKGWNIANDWATQAISVQSGVSVSRAPKAVIERVWRWNVARVALEQRTPDVFYPSMLFVEIDGRISTMLTWSGLPIILPSVDIILLGRPAVPGKPLEYTLQPYDDVTARLIGYEPATIAGVSCMQPVAGAQFDAGTQPVFDQPFHSPPMSIVAAEKVLAETA